MSGTDVAVYRMNPQTDRIVYGDELTEGMWVLPESPTARSRGGRDDEDSLIRAQRFRQVTRLHRSPAVGETPEMAVFIAVWVDGYSEVHRFGLVNAWLVRTEPDAAADGETTP